MDMQAKNSLYKYLVDAGFTLFSISWKNPDQSTVELDWDYIKAHKTGGLELRPEPAAWDALGPTGA